MQFAIRLKQLEKTYSPGLLRRPVHALRGLDLDVRRDELYGIVGLNGAGKTTAFKIILGLLTPTNGGGEVLGAPLGDRLARARLGFLPELPAYYPHLDGGEVLRFARALSGVARDDQRDRQILESLGVGQAYSRRTRKLSKGQLQRVGLAQAIVHEPELLILDEPMSGLDPVARGLVKDMLREQRQAGRTVVLSTHVLTDIESLADRVGLIQDGALLREGSPRELLSGSAREVKIEGCGVSAETIARTLEGSVIAAGDGSWAVTLSGHAALEVDTAIRQILGVGGEILQIETIREDLESMFVRSVEGAKECA